MQNLLFSFADLSVKDKVVKELSRQFKRAGAEVAQIDVPSQMKRASGVTYKEVAIIFELSDGQTITIFFHNPDTTPQRLAPTDELISWKWLLNKKDVTIVVAPERGKDLNVREVARRILRLAAKNSAAFQRANARRAERLQEVQKLKDEITGLEKALFSAEFTIATLELELEEAKEKQKKGLAKAPGVPTKANGGEVKKAKDPNTGPNTEIAEVTPPAQEEKPVEQTVAEPEQHAQAKPGLPDEVWDLPLVSQEGFEILLANPGVRDSGIQVKEYEIGKYAGGTAVIRAYMERNDVEMVIVWNAEAKQYKGEDCRACARDRSQRSPADG